MRVLLVVALSLVGLFAALSCVLLMAFALHPWPGDPRRPLAALGYAVAAVAGAALPAAAGAVLLPGPRRAWTAVAVLLSGGALVSMACLLGFG